MGYDIYIGEAKVDASEEDLYACFAVKGLSLADAPVFRGDETTANSNCRSPGYGAWTNFTRLVGLHAAFFDDEASYFFTEDDALMSKHPGIRRLRPAHLKIFEHALESYQQAHPGVKPGACQCADCVPADSLFKPDGLPHDPDLKPFTYDDIPHPGYNLVRLHWLVWWTRWALENCKIPAIYNT